MSEGLINMESDINIKNNIVLASADAIKQICGPLFDFLGVDYFSFARVYTDGRRIRLCTDPVWVEHFYRAKLYNISVFERSPSLYMPGQFLWSNNSNNTGLEILKKHLREEYNRDHVLSIVRTQNDFMDVFNIAGKVNAIDIENKYFMYMECIHKFINYFLVEANKFILQAEKEKFLVPIDDSKFLSDDGSGLQKDLKYGNFMDQIKLTQVFLDTPIGVVLLSPRETQSLVLTLKGKTSKEIAKILALSPRSIEKYIDNIKLKSGYHNRSDIYDNALKSESVRFMLSQ